MTITVKNLISMMKSRRFREQQGLATPPKPTRKPNYTLARKIMDDYVFPEDDDAKKPPDK